MRGMFGFLSVLLVACLLSCNAEAGHRNKSRIRCGECVQAIPQSDSSELSAVERTGSDRVFLSGSSTGAYVPVRYSYEKFSIESRFSSVSVASSVSGDWNKAAVAEASSGLPNKHAYSASQLATIAGHPQASVFVGVGCNGSTCRGSGRLVGEATVGAKTARIWLQ